MSDFVGDSEEDLKALLEEDKIFIGRNKAVHSGYGAAGALLLGRSVEKKEYKKPVFLDAVSPHVIFICGARGSGKSYSGGVIAEELTMRNPNLACVVIDPVGIFWSMKYPNKEEKELEELLDWGLEPVGIKKTQIFIPEGMKKNVPGGTYDLLFSLRPVELTADDWCLTFGLDRFSPTGLLLGKVLEKARDRYGNNYGLDDLLGIIEKDKEITSKDRGYKTDTRRALASRLEAAKGWGILSKDATSLAEICKEGTISVIDISFLEENVASLVIGMLARKILNARKLATRKAAMHEYKMQDIDELLNVEIPPTWLIIDEAHTLIPSGAIKTPASDPLIEYVKQGRRPGCSLVFITQQPGAIDTKVLSQLDLVICHKLVFDQDLNAVMKRMPTLLPKEYEKTRFLKTLPIGIALVGDRSEQTSRAFCIQIRPRLSQHEGREIHAAVGEAVDKKKIAEMITNLIYEKLGQQGELSLRKVDELADMIKRRYEVKVDTADIIKALEKRGCVLGEEKIVLPGFEERAVEEITEGEKNAFPIRVPEEAAWKLAEKNRKRKTLFWGKEEKVKEVKLVYEPVYRVDYDLILEKGFKPLSCFVDADFNIYYWSRGLQKIDISDYAELDEKKMRVLRAVQKARAPEKIASCTGLTAQAVGRYLKELAEQGFIKKGKKGYELRRRLKIVSLDSPDFSKILGRVGLESARGERMKMRVDEKKIEKIPALFGDAKVREVTEFLKPVWMVTFISADGERVQGFDAI